MTYRNKCLTAQAHTMPCMADFPHDCTGYIGCEPAHSDHHIFGRGKDHKSADWAFAAMCHNAHQQITAKPGTTIDREQKFYDWLRAFKKTHDWLWENKRVRLA